MKTLFIAVLILASALVFGLSTIARADSAPAWSSAAIAPQAMFLQNPTTAVATPSSGGGTARSHLPSSVMNHQDPVCSVDTTDNPAVCSVDNTVASRRCSAHCNSNQRCSAFAASAGGPTAQCSTLGVNRALCSTLQPDFGIPGDSQCSAFGGPLNTRILCSVLAPAKKQYCSAENVPNSNRNPCSAFGAGPGFVFCSIFGGGLTNKNFCSTGRLGPKLCSTFDADTECSITINNRGICSNLVGAPVGSCSAHAAPSHCSVLGGAAGTFCKNP